jgi:hypothetical protein
MLIQGFTEMKRKEISANCKSGKLRLSKNQKSENLNFYNMAFGKISRNHLSKNYSAAFIFI